VHLLNNFPTFYEIQRVITVFVSQINPVGTSPFSLKSALILSTHLRLGHLSGLFSSDFLINILYAFLSSFVLHALRITLLNLIILIILGEEYKSCTSPLRSFLKPPVTSSLFDPNILLSTVPKHRQSMFLH
jgi:hypothetical protein